MIRIADGAGPFADAVLASIDDTAAARERRQAVARANRWEDRAAAFMTFADAVAEEKGRISSVT